MALIPVNPERRDPGYIRKKAELGLSNVDNISAADFVNIVAEDVDIINNQKVTSSEITYSSGDFYAGILKTADLTSHIDFTTGLFRSTLPGTELAAVNAVFSFSTISATDTGTLAYQIQVPDSDKYLQDKYLVFTQVGGEVYVCLYLPSLPKSTDDYYFNQIGTNLIDWTEDTVLLDSSKNYYDIIKNGIELGRIKLDSAKTSIQSELCDSLPVYEDGVRIKMEARNYSSSEMAKYDYPSINGVPFIARLGLKIGNKEAGRQITVPAYHSGSSKSEAGEHEWECLKDIRTIGYKYASSVYTPSSAVQTTNNDSLGFGLCKPTKYNATFSPEAPTKYSEAVTAVRTWMNSLGDNTDVMTVGSFRTFMSYFLTYVLGNMSTKEDEGDTEETVTGPWSMTVSPSDEQTLESTGGSIQYSVLAERNIYTYKKGVLTNTTQEKAKDSQITVTCAAASSVSNVDDGVWLVSVGSYNLGRGLIVTIKVDSGKDSEVSKTLYINQTAYTDPLVSTEYAFSRCDMVTPIPSTLSTYKFDVEYLVTKTYQSGTTSQSVYSGHNINISWDEETYNYISIEQDDMSYGWKLTVGENTTGAPRDFVFTTTYQGISKDITITQEAASEEDTLLSYSYTFSVYSQDPTTLDPDGGGPNHVSLNTWLTENYSKSGQVITEKSFSVKSYPEWFTAKPEISDGTDFDYSWLKNDSGEDRTGEIVLVQADSGKELTITVSQATPEKTISSDVWGVWSNGMNTSTISCYGENRILSISYRHDITYSDGTSDTEFYGGSDIVVTVTRSVPGNSATVTFVSEGAFSIAFPDAASDVLNTWSIQAEYKGIKSTVISIGQQGSGGTVVNTDYTFKTTNSAAQYLYASADQDAEVSISIDSYAVDTYSTGMALNNPKTFTATTNDSWVTCGVPTLNEDNKSYTISFLLTENTGDEDRYGTGVVLTQASSGKTLTLYISQAHNEITYYIKVNGTKYYDDDECTVDQFTNATISKTLTVVPGCEINGEDSDSGSLTSSDISESISWLSCSLSGTSLKLTGQENTAGSVRSGSIYLSYEGIDVTLLVSQAAGSSYITVDGENSDITKYVTKESQSLTVSVSSNYPYTITKSTSSSWISLTGSSSKSSGNTSISFTIDENTSASNRSATFTLTSSSGSTRKITVTQYARTNYIDVVGDPTTTVSEFSNHDIYLGLSSSKDYVVLKISSNVSWFVDDYPDDFLVLYTSNNTSSGLNNTYLKNLAAGSYPFEEAEDFTNTAGGMVSSTAYLFIKVKSDSLSDSLDDGVISLSYYNNGVITCGRKIRVVYDKNSNVNPLGCQTRFYSGDEGYFSVYGYTNSTNYFDVNITGGSGTEETYSSDDSDGWDSLTECQVYFPDGTNDTGECVPNLYNYDSFSGDECTVYQYPYRSLSLYYLGTYGKYVNTVNITSESQVIPITHSGVCASGHIDLYSSSLPGWVSMYSDPFVDSTGSSNIAVQVDPNTTGSSRSVTLEFWCDSDTSTITSFTINQSAGSSSSTQYVTSDYSVLTASSSSNYIYLYNVKETSSQGATYNKILEQDTNGNNASAGLNYGLTRSSSNTFKLTYSISSTNAYYDRDYFLGLSFTSTSGETKKIFIKNPRSSKSFVQGVSSLNTSNNQQTVVYKFSYTTNIGFDGFAQSSDTGYSFPVSKTTSDTSPSSSTSVTFSSYNHPEKIWGRSQINDYLYLRNLDVLPGYVETIPVTLSSNFGRYGIELQDIKSSKSLSSITNTTASASYSIYLDYSQKNSSGTNLTYELAFKCYDGVTVTTSQSGNGFTLTDYIPTIVGQVGSLGYNHLYLQTKSDNTGSSAIFLGSITIKTEGSITRTINVYQSANTAGLYGTVTISSHGDSNSNGNNIVMLPGVSSYTYTPGLTFTHTYSNWMAITNGVENANIPFPTYSTTFGSASNSGTSNTVSNSVYTSGVPLKLDSSSLTNTKLELVSLGTIGLVSAYSTSSIADYNKASCILGYYLRPVDPSSGLKIVSGSAIGTISGSSYSYTVTAAVQSNYITYCSQYVGKTLKMNGSSKSITSTYDVYDSLATNPEITITYSDGTTETKSISKTSYTTTTVSGIPTVVYTTTFTTTKSIKTVKGKVGMSDFVVDSSIYKSRGTSYVETAEITPTLSDNTQYTLSYTASPTDGGYIQYSLGGNSSYRTLGSTGVSITSGTTVYIKAIPNTGYTFSQWQGTDESGSTTNEHSFTMTKNMSKVPCFGKTQLTISGAVSPSGSGTVYCGVYGATPTPLTTTRTYDYGTSLYISASPSSGYNFSSWSGLVTGTTNSTTFTLTSSGTVTANMVGSAVETGSLTLVTSPTDGGGSIQYKIDGDYLTVTSGTTVSVPVGKTVYVKGVPNDGYTFSSWQGTTVSGATTDGNTCSFTMPSGTVTRIAVFSVAKYTLNVTSSPAAGGTIQYKYGASGTYATLSSSALSVEAGTVVYLKATANSGYTWNGWNGTNTSTSSVTEISFTMPSSTVSETASFVAQTTKYTLTCKTSGAGSGYVYYKLGSSDVYHVYSSAVSVASGTTVYVKAVVNSGTFSRWSGAVSGTTNPTSFTMNADKTVTATFLASSSGGSGGGGCCFVAGTQILTSMDGETKNIEDIQIGDKVVSYNPETGINYLANVSNTVINTQTVDVARVTLENGQIVEMNAYHPILTKFGWHSITNFNGLDTLVVGDQAKIVDGYSKIVDITRWRTDPFTTYNLSVVDDLENPDDDTNDNFYANGICAHNVAQNYQCAIDADPLL